MAAAPHATLPRRIGSTPVLWRAPRSADLPAWARLVAAVEATDRTGEAFTEDDLADELALSWAEPDRNATFAFADDGEAVAWAWVQCRPEATRMRRVLLQGAVHPGLRGLGAGSAMLLWLERRGAALATERSGGAPDGVPTLLEMRARQGDQPREQLFARHGYTPLRYYLDMRRDLSGEPPAPDAPRGLALVPFDRTLDEATRAAHNEAFLDHWGSEPLDREMWTRFITGHRDFRPDLSWLALDGDMVAGYALGSVHRQDWAAAGYSLGWIHELGVRRPWRGRGVARALLDATLRSFTFDGLQYGGLDVDAQNPTGALGLYERAGFSPHRTWIAWSKPLFD